MSHDKRRQVTRSAPLPGRLAAPFANVGGKPVTVQRVGGSYEGGETFVSAEAGVSLPLRLEPATSIVIKRPGALLERDMSKVGVWDSTERFWDAKVGSFRKEVEAWRKATRSGRGVGEIGNS